MYIKPNIMSIIFNNMPQDFEPLYAESLSICIGCVTSIEGPLIQAT